MPKLETDSKIHPLLFDLLFLIQVRMKAVVKDSDVDLSPLQVLILRTLVEHGEMSQQTLGQKVAKDKAQITRLIHELERKQLIIKERSSTDRRSFIIKASEEVYDKVSHFIQYEKRLVIEMIAGLTESEIINLEKALSLAVNNLRNERKMPPR